MGELAPNTSQNIENQAQHMRSETEPVYVPQHGLERTGEYMSKHSRAEEVEDVVADDGGHNELMGQYARKEGAFGPKKPEHPSHNDLMGMYARKEGAFAPKTQEAGKDVEQEQITPEAQTAIAGVLKNRGFEAGASTEDARALAQEAKAHEATAEAARARIAEVLANREAAAATPAATPAEAAVSTSEKPSVEDVVDATVEALKSKDLSALAKANEILDQLSPEDQLKAMDIVEAMVGNTIKLKQGAPGAAEQKPEEQPAPAEAKPEEKPAEEVAEATKAPETPETEADEKYDGTSPLRLLRAASRPKPKTEGILTDEEVDLLQSKPKFSERFGFTKAGKARDAKIAEINEKTAGLTDEQFAAEMRRGGASDSETVERELVSSDDGETASWKSNKPKGQNALELMQSWENSNPNEGEQGNKEKEVPAQSVEASRVATSALRDQLETARRAAAEAEEEKNK